VSTHRFKGNDKHCEFAMHRKNVRCRKAGIRRGTSCDNCGAQGLGSHSRGGSGSVSMNSLHTCSSDCASPPTWCVSCLRIFVQSDKLDAEPTNAILQTVCLHVLPLLHSREASVPSNWSSTSLGVELLETGRIVAVDATQGRVSHCETVYSALKPWLRNVYCNRNNQATHVRPKVFPGPCEGLPQQIQHLEGHSAGFWSIGFQKS